MKKIIKYLFMLHLFLFTGNLMAQTIGMRIPDTSVVAGDIIEIPIYADSSLTGRDIYSYMLQISCNTTYLRADSVLTGGTLSGTFGSTTVNFSENGKVTIAGAGASTLEGSGVFLYIRYEVLSEWGTSISFTGEQNNYFNEGSPAMNFNDGYVTIAAPPKITIYPNSGLLMTGEQIQFTVSGDTVSPFQWTVADEQVASIDENGLLTAVRPALIKVSVTDANNLSDKTNDLIEVRGYKLSIPGDLSQWQGGVIDIPVYTTDLTALNVVSGSFTLGYNQNILIPTEVLISGTLLESQNVPEVSFSNGYANIAFATTTALSGEGVLIYLRCNVSSENTGSSYISFSNVLLNEDLLAITTNGYFTSIDYANIYISPSVATLIAGDSLEFTASGGVEPYTWDTDNHEIGTIDSNGMFHAIRSGVVHAMVEDSVGATKISGDIRIYDTEVFIPDTTGPANSIFDLPVYIKDLPPGQSVSSIEAGFSYRTPELEFVEIVSDGSLTEGWTFAQSTENNSFLIAGAGTTGFNTAGVFFFIRFQLTSEMALNENAWVNIDEMLINEGIPDVKTYNGSITGTKNGDLGVSFINSPVTFCGLSANEAINITVYNYGYITYNTGDTIVVGYQLDSNTPIVDSIFLTSDFYPSTSIDFTFITTIDLSVLGSYSLSAYTSLSDEEDGNPSNNTFTSIIENVDELPVDLGEDQTACEGDTVDILAGSGFDTYTWSNAVSTTELLRVTEAGTYSVTVTSGATCEVSDTIEVFFNPLPIVDLGLDIEICEGESVDLIASGGTDYEWNTLEITASISVNPVVTTTYYVTVTENFCSDIDSVVVTVIPAPEMPVGTDTSLCYDGNPVTLFATGNTVIWYADSLLTEYLFTGSTYASGISEVGEYTFYITQQSGACESLPDTINLSITSQPATPIAENVEVCFGESVPDLTASGENIQWYSDAELTILVHSGSDFASGQTEARSYTYYVTQTSNTCESESTMVTLTINDLPVIPIITQNVNTLISSEAFAYQWLDQNQIAIEGSIEQSYDPPASAIYYVEVSDENNCSSISDPFDFIKTRIHDIELSYELVIYPNPNDGIFTLKVEIPYKLDNVIIEVINMSGTKVMHKEFAEVSTNIVHKFDLSHASSGLYLIKIITAEGIQTMLIQKL